MNHHKFPTTQLFRHLIQLAAFILFPGLFLSAFSAVGSVVSALVNGTFSVSALASQLFIIIAVFPVSILWGRFFCGWLCSFGAMGDLIYYISCRINPRRKRQTVPEQAEKYLKSLKYFVLAFIVILQWLLGVSLSSGTSPWNVFGMLTSRNLSAMAAAVPTIGFVLLVLIIAGSFFIERFFCRYLCPLGAIFSIISLPRLFNIRRKESDCIGERCALCTKNCSMGLNVHETKVVRSGECIDCMNCMSVCPRQSLRSNPNPAIAGTAAALVMTGLVTVGRLTTDSISVTPTTAYAAENTKGSFTDGTYTGSGTGFRGTTKVTVTVENGNITDITVDSYEDDQEYFSRAQNTVIGEIISGQSVSVTPVSGATYSSNSIMTAVADALGVDADVTTPSEGHLSIQSAAESSSETESETAAAETETAAATETTESETAAATEAAGSGLSSLSDGTYTGSGTGFRGTTDVSVTVKNHKITDITITSYEDDDEFFERAKSTVIEEIIDNQSVDVQTVSGATFSSNGILEAVADAIGADFSNPNSENSGGGHGRMSSGSTGSDSTYSASSGSTSSGSDSAYSGSSGSDAVSGASGTNTGEGI